MALFKKKPIYVDPIDHANTLASEAIGVFDSVVEKLHSANEHLESAVSSSLAMIEHHNAQATAHSDRISTARNAQAKNDVVAKKVAALTS